MREILKAIFSPMVLAGAVIAWLMFVGIAWWLFYRETPFAKAETRALSTEATESSYGSIS